MLSSVSQPRCFLSVSNVDACLDVAILIRTVYDIRTIGFSHSHQPDSSHRLKITGLHEWDR